MIDFFGRRYRALFEQATLESQSLRESLEQERAKRITAEALASTLREQVEYFKGLAEKATAHAQELATQRINSMDQMNAKLLGTVESAPQNAALLKRDPVMKRKVQAVSYARRERQLMRDAGQLSKQVADSAVKQ